jgi:hypothetical protein
MELLKRWKQTTLANKLMVVTTAIVAFGTLFYACVAVFQWKMMEESGKQTSEQIDKLITQSRRIADTSDETAKQSKKVLDTTIENFHLEQRAWIGFASAADPEYTEGGKMVYVKEGEPVKAEIILINSGKTPARNLHTLAQMVLLRSDIKLITSFDKKMSQHPSVGVILPNGKIKIKIPQIPNVGGISKADVANITNGHFIVYIVGKFTYDDVFGKSHSTLFCSQIIPNLTNFKSCDHYNDAD